MNRQDIEDILPLTPMQESMLFQHLKEPDSQLHFEQTCYRLTGEVEVDKVREAWNAAAAANEMLRTVFRWQGLKTPVQVIFKNRPVPITEIDLSQLSHETRQYQLNQIKKHDRQKKLDLAGQPLRVILCKLAENNYEMIVSNHHIIYDGWSNVIILKELSEAYQQIHMGKKWFKPAKNRYKEYIKWQQHQDKPGQTRYWKRYLNGFTDSTSFSAQSSSSSPKNTPAPGGEEKRYEYPVPEDLHRDINAFSRQEGVTLAALLYGAWAILLHKYRDVEDILFGITVSGRDSRVKGIQDIVGLFINTLPLRINISPEDEIGDFLEKVGNLLLEMEEFENTPLAEIMACSEIGPRQSLFDSVVVIQNYPLDETWFKEESKLRICLTTRFYMTKISLALGVRAFQRIILDFSYNVNVFNEQRIRELARHLVTVIKTIVTHTHTPTMNQQTGPGNPPGKNLKIKDIKILDQKERELMVCHIRENRKKLAEIQEVDFDEIF